MYYMVKGKGCDDCPFRYLYYDNGDQGYECALHLIGMKESELAGGDEKPYDCPFRTGEQIEIYAEETE